MKLGKIALKGKKAGENTPEANAEPTQQASQENQLAELKQAPKKAKKTSKKNKGSKGPGINLGAMGGSTTKFLGIGALLILISIGMTVWNEAQFMTSSQKASRSAENVVTTIKPNLVDPLNDGKLVHFTSSLSAEQPLTDRLFGIKSSGVKLRRIVEMYQWRENAGKYQKGWYDEWIDSGKFKDKRYKNPSKMPFKSDEWTASPIKAGSFSLDPIFTDQLTQFSKLSLSEGDLKALPKSLKKVLKLHEGGLYYGNPEKAQIGAIRIRFEEINPDIVSLAGRQKGASLTSFMAPSGPIHFLKTGQHSADSMLPSMRGTGKTGGDAPGMIGWMLRLAGLVLFIAGLWLIFKPIAILADTVPFLSHAVSAGIPMVVTLAGASLYSLLITLLWLGESILVAGGTLLITVITGGLLFGTLKRNAQRARKFDEIKNAPSETLATETPDEMPAGPTGFGPQAFTKAAPAEDTAPVEPEAEELQVDNPFGAPIEQGDATQATAQTTEEAPIPDVPVESPFAPPVTTEAAPAPQQEATPSEAPFDNAPQEQPAMDNPFATAPVEEAPTTPGNATSEDSDGGASPFDAPIPPVQEDAGNPFKSQPVETQQIEPEPAATNPFETQAEQSAPPPVESPFGQVEVASEPATELTPEVQPDMPTEAISEPESETASDDDSGLSLAAPEEPMPTIPTEAIIETPEPVDVAIDTESDTTGEESADGSGLSLETNVDSPIGAPLSETVPETPADIPEMPQIETEGPLELATELATEPAPIAKPPAETPAYPSEDNADMSDDTNADSGGFTTAPSPFDAPAEAPAEPAEATTSDEEDKPRFEPQAMQAAIAATQEPEPSESAAEAQTEPASDDGENNGDSGGLSPFDAPLPTATMEVPVEAPVEPAAETQLTPPPFEAPAVEPTVAISPAAEAPAAPAAEDNTETESDEGGANPFGQPIPTAPAAAPFATSPFDAPAEAPAEPSPPPMPGAEAPEAPTEKPKETPATQVAPDNPFAQPIPTQSEDAAKDENDSEEK